MVDVGVFDIGHLVCDYEHLAKAGSSPSLPACCRNFDLSEVMGVHTR